MLANTGIVILAALVCGAAIIVFVRKRNRERAQREELELRAENLRALEACIAWIHQSSEQSHFSPAAQTSETPDHVSVDEGVPDEFFGESMLGAQPDSGIVPAECSDSEVPR